MLLTPSCCESSNYFFFFRSVPEASNKFAIQDLPCSLLQPVIESCHLYGGRVRGQYNFRCLPHLSHLLCKRMFSHLRVAISSLHQWFTCVHLSITYLPSFKRLFLDRSPPNLYKSSSARRLDNSTWHSVADGPLSIICKRTYHGTSKDRKDKAQSPQMDWY